PLAHPRSAGRLAPAERARTPPPHLTAAASHPRGRCRERRRICEAQLRRADRLRRPAYRHFFFQAEDGIRDGHVTGVQTCALPISTVESLAQLIREGGEANPDPVVMEIQSGGDGLPFFAVASPGVETLGFGLLARHMGPDRPVYKLQGHAPIVVGRPFTKEDLRLLSQEYIAAMRA